MFLCFRSINVSGIEDVDLIDLVHLHLLLLLPFLTTHLRVEGNTFIEHFVATGILLTHQVVTSSSGAAALPIFFEVGYLHPLLGLTVLGSQHSNNIA